MGKILFGNSEFKMNSEKKLNTNGGFISDRDLLKQRSKDYLNLIATLDHEMLSTTKGMEDLLEAIKEEFGTASISSLPLGIVAKCFLGAPYEVHSLDLCGANIIRHYKQSEQMEASFEKARNLAQHNAYALIEVYADKMILIREDGSATKV